MEQPIHRALGLADEELTMIEEILGRGPNYVELAMYSVMWSEHCSYKSSRLHLRRLPSKGEKVLVGPGENAGVIDAGDGIAVAIRMESHNHPSAIEPYQGAATGVGGILRDIFTMGARPIALLDSLRMGEASDPRNRYIYNGVVAGISGYGNAVGVPTVGGEIVFDPTYDSNPLVNVAAVGVLPVDKLVFARAEGVGNQVILLGSPTGRDGIGGVSVLASAGFGADVDSSKRPSVQVGDPYEEKRLIEACLELLDAKLVVGIQDLGGAGLSCASSETAANAGLGMDVYVERVPRREANMEPFEVMTSESQERMLAIVTPQNVPAVLAIAEKWEIPAAVVGIVTAPETFGGREGVGMLRIFEDGRLVAEVPAKSLADGAPLYDRPRARPEGFEERAAQDPTDACRQVDVPAELAKMVFDPKEIYSQYDHQLFLNTVVGPGANATLLRLSSPEIGYSRKGIGLSADGNSRWCALDPRRGSELLVAESALNVALVGAVPTCMVDCLNFGNPEHPEVMWELSESIDGIAKASNELGVPVVGGNVSLYNEARGRDIEPTPVLTTLGLVDEVKVAPPAKQYRSGDALVMVGEAEANLAGSRLAWVNLGLRGGVLPQLDYPRHQQLIDAVVELVRKADGFSVTAISDISDGGLGLCLFEMARASGLGFELEGIGDDPVVELFSESPSRVVLATSAPDQVVAHFAAAGLPARVIGRVTDSKVASFGGGASLAL
ncbi:MAG: phosphoribosylformylglycinamidine synthase subunit PurL [Actinomycetota bacterium]|nr:phosphoribosylformylglycinamidine synthase subunit PurL [Actinomycetota bacterium]